MAQCIGNDETLAQFGDLEVKKIHVSNLEKKFSLLRGLKIGVSKMKFYDGSVEDQWLAGVPKTL